MSRAASFALFVGIALSILGAVHWYVWVRLVANPAPPPGLRRALSAALVLLYLSIPLTFFMSRVKDPAVRLLATLPGSVWMGVVFILFALVSGGDLLRLVAAMLQRIVGDAAPSDPERRVTIARLFAFAVTFLGGGASAAALRSGLARVEVKEVRVKLSKLPKALHGTVIVQLTDVHVGAASIGRAFVEDIVARANALSPDLVAITGDLVDGSVSRLGEHVAPIQRLRSRFGTFFVTGNHEYYSGTEAWCAELRRLGVRVLRNERVSIGEGADGFDLAGVDDHEAGRFGGMSDVARALAGRDPAREVVLLAHQPRAVREAEKYDVGLQLSGHTHGGQIWPWKYFVYLQQPVVEGLARFGRTVVYVSRGTGYWGPPMRLAAPAEITKIVLESGAV